MTTFQFPSIFVPLVGLVFPEIAMATIGKAVILPSPKLELDLAALSKRRECK